MKKLLFLIVGLFLVSGAVFAQLPPVGYIGLFADDAHSIWCATGSGFYPVEMWLWCLPSERGMLCLEFAIEYPLNVIQSTGTWHPDMGIWIEPPDIEEGASVCYLSCRWDWVWVFHQLLYVTDPSQTYAQIVPHSDIGVYRFANCEPGFPVEPCIKLANLYFNYDPLGWECMYVGTEDASWGAIKSMVSE